MSHQTSGRTHSRSAGILARAATLLILVVLTVVLVIRLLQKHPEGGEPRLEAKTVVIHLTKMQEAALPAWGRKIAEMLSTDQGEELSQLHDYEAITALTVEGIDGQDERRLVERAMRNAVTAKAGGFLAKEVGQSAHFLRVCTRAGFPAATVRMTYGSRQFAYMDVLLRPVGDQFRIVDLYDYLKGTRRTEEVRYAMAPMMIAQQSQPSSAWLQKMNLNKSDADYLVLLMKARIRGTDEDVLTACDQAPEHMRDNRLVFFPRTQVLQRLSITNPRYEQLYFESLQNPPPMPDTPHVLDLLLVPKLIDASDYPKADAAMEKVMSVIGEDAQLMCMRAEIKVELKDMDAAKALLQRAAELEPELPLLHEVKKGLALQ